MTNKIKIFGREIEWYDVKTKFKKLLRGLLYLRLTQSIICRIIIIYMWLVYLTSKKEFINCQKDQKHFQEGRSIILAFWHNRLMMAPFYARYVRKKLCKKSKFMTLASKHGDGRFVGEVMNNFGFKNIYGSSQDKRKSSRGIDLKSLRYLIKSLKSGRILGITPDGPRGPNQKINSEIVNIAKISNSIILPISYSSSRFIEFNSWDKFKLPLPFSKINFYAGDPLEFSKENDEEGARLKLEQKMNDAQEKSTLNLS